MSRRPANTIAAARAQRDFSSEILSLLEQRNLEITRYLHQGPRGLKLYTLKHQGAFYQRTHEEVVGIAEGKLPANLSKSEGHVGYAYGFEYFFVASGDLYRASVQNPMDLNGYRQGARFEANVHTADFALKQAGLR